MRLFAKVSDPELFLRALNEAGTAFYRIIKKNLVEAVYFSSNRTVYFKGDMNPKQFNALKAQAYPSEKIHVDEVRGQVEISQFEEED